MQWNPVTWLKNVLAGDIFLKFVEVFERYFAEPAQNYLKNFTLGSSNSSVGHILIILALSFVVYGCPQQLQYPCVYGRAYKLYSFQNAIFFKRFLSQDFQHPEMMLKCFSSLSK